MTFLVQNCSFHEMIISVNTERGSLKLTRCSYRKKRMERKIYQQRERWNTKWNLHFWTEGFFFLTCRQVFFSFSLRGGLDLIKIHSRPGRVVQKAVNINPGLNVNWSITFSCLKMFFTCNVWCSLRILQLQTEGQTSYKIKLKSKLSLTLG